MLNMSQHVSVWEVLRKGSLKCGGEHYLKRIARATLHQSLRG